MRYSDKKKTIYNSLFRIRREASYSTVFKTRPKRRKVLQKRAINANSISKAAEPLTTEKKAVSFID